MIEGLRKIARCDRRETLLCAKYAQLVGTIAPYVHRVIPIQKWTTLYDFQF